MSIKKETIIIFLLQNEINGVRTPDNTGFTLKPNEKNQVL